MAYIKVNINSILSYRDLLVSVKNKAVEIRNQFVSLANSVDWNVKGCDAIFESMNKIVVEFDAEDSTIRNHVNYLNKARVLYGYLEGNTENIATGTVSGTKITSSTAKDTAESQIGKKENVWYEDTVSDGFKLHSLLENLFDKNQPFTNLGMSKYSVDVGFVIPSVLGFKSLIYEVYNNTVDRVTALNQIENDETLTPDEKEYMKNVINTLSDADAGIDALSWGVGCIPLVGDMASFFLDHLDDAYNSESVKSELLEGYREINDAKKDLEQAEGFFEKTGAAIKVGWEYVETAVEVQMAVSKEFVCDVIETGCEMVNNLIVEPVKQVWNGVKNLFKGW